MGCVRGGTCMRRRARDMGHGHGLQAIQDESGRRYATPELTSALVPRPSLCLPSSLWRPSAAAALSQRARVPVLEPAYLAPTAMHLKKKSVTGAMSCPIRTLAASLGAPTVAQQGPHRRPQHQDSSGRPRQDTSGLHRRPGHGQDSPRTHQDSPGLTQDSPRTQTDSPCSSLPALAVPSSPACDA